MSTAEHDTVRLRLDLGYDGSGFAGWAIQPGQRTVQDVLEAALATALRIPSPRLVVAGRTDAGVHAAAQVAHVDVPRTAWDAARTSVRAYDAARTSRAFDAARTSRAFDAARTSTRSLVPDAAAADGAPPSELLRRLAGLLPPDVRVFSVAQVPAAFDARFSALWRLYEYRISDADHGVEPLRRHDTAGWRHRLDAARMAEAAPQLLGLHDFTAFCRRRDGATTVRQLQQLDVTRDGDLVLITVRADAFCHSMVRSLVGALAAVGDGRQSIEWPASLLTNTARADDVTVAPAIGLTLIEVRYPAQHQFGARSVLTRARRSVADPMTVQAERLLDLSVVVTTGMPVYPSDPQVAVGPALRIAEHGVNVAAVHLGSQSGTHVDSPNHTLADGLVLADLPLSRFIGPAVVADLRALGPRQPITVESLAPILDELKPGCLLLLCTGWSSRWGTEEYLAHPWLEPAATQAILDRGVRTIGVDALSIDPSPALDAAGLPSHHLIAAAGGVIAENLTALDSLLEAMAGGAEAEIMLFPIRLDAVDGAPVRAMARLSL